MPVRFVAYAPASEVPCLDEVRRLVNTYGQARVVVTTGDERARIREGIAREGLAMGAGVTTPASLVEELWSYAGGNRRLLSAAERQLIVARLLERGEHDLVYNPGTVRVLSRGAAQTSVVLSGADRTKLTAPQQVCCDFMSSYLELCESLGVTDLSEAASELSAGSRVSVLASHPLVLLNLTHYPHYLVSLVAAIASASEAVVLVSPWQVRLAVDLAERIAMLRPDLEVTGLDEVRRVCEDAPLDDKSTTLASIANPSGHDAGYARLVLERVREGANTVLVTSPDPLGLAETLALRLAPQDIAVRGVGRRPVARSVAGEQLLALAELAHDMRSAEPGAWWPAPALTDWLRSPVCGVPARGLASSFDRMMRMTRAFQSAHADPWPVTPELALDMLEREVKRSASNLSKREVESLPEVAFGVPRALYEGKVARAVSLLARGCEFASVARFGAQALSAQQESARTVEALRDIAHAAAKVDVTPDVALDIMSLVCTRVDVDYKPDGEARAHVLVCDLSSACAMSPRNVDALVCTDVDSGRYSLADRPDPLHPLQEELACDAVHARGSGAHRDQFFRAFYTSRGPVVLARVTHDFAGDETYPALVWDEVKRETEPSEVEYVGTLFANADMSFGAGAEADSVEIADPWHLGDTLGSWVLTDRRAFVRDGQLVGREAAMSASQIETILACPMSWLIGNRVGKNEVGVGFTPLERGNFVHDVMQRLHVITAPGGSREGEDRRTLIDEVFWQIAEEHLCGRHGNKEEPCGRVQAPYVPLTSYERAQMEQLLDVLRIAVDYEEGVLSSFEPALFEYSFDKADVTYAGRRLGGRIDRVDIGVDHDGSTRLAAVIDYKHRRNLDAYSLKDPTMVTDEEHPLPDDWAPQSKPSESPKVQTLIYARAIERALESENEDIHAVAALYFGTSGPVMHGAASDIIVARGELEGTKACPFPGDPGKSRNLHEGTMSFEELMDRTEECVRRAYEDLGHGNVEPNELTGGCGYCPLLFCERRH